MQEVSGGHDRRFHSQSQRLPLAVVLPAAPVAALPVVAPLPLPVVLPAAALAPAALPVLVPVEPVPALAPVLPVLPLSDTVNYAMKTFVRPET